jgi:hypothetical protein
MQTIRFIIKFGIIFILLTDFYIQTAGSQNLEYVIKFADSQYEQRNFAIATIEYQRALFFNNKDSLNEYLFKQVANCFFFQQDYLNAALYYDYSYSTSKSDSLKYELIFKKSACYILSLKFKYAMNELVNLNDSLPSYFEKKRNYYLGICYFGLEDFSKAENYFINAIDQKDISNKKLIQELFRNKKDYMLPKPETAQLLSIILPGLGQLYAGDIKNALNSFLLIDAFIVLALSVSVNYTIFETFIAVFPWFQRYYQGGYQKAKQIATNKRKIKRNNFYHRLNNIQK